MVYHMITCSKALSLTETSPKAALTEHRIHVPPSRIVAIGGTNPLCLRGCISFGEYVFFECFMY